MTEIKLPVQADIEAIKERLDWLEKSFFEMRREHHQDRTDMLNWQARAKAAEEQLADRDKRCHHSWYIPPSKLMEGICICRTCGAGAMYKSVDAPTEPETHEKDA